MKYRKLRIAWSVVWGIACLLLIVLWVRSYHWFELVDFRVGPNTFINIGSVAGNCAFHYRTDVATRANFSVSQTAIDNVGAANLNQHFDKIANFRIGSIVRVSRAEVGNATNVFVAYGLVEALLIAGAVVPWLPWRFSLRTLLIVTTLVAVGLGWAVYVLRN